MATIPTWLRGVGGTAIPTSWAVGAGGARRPAERAFLSISGVSDLPQHAQSLFSPGACMRKQSCMRRLSRITCSMYLVLFTTSTRYLLRTAVL